MRAGAKVPTYGSAQAAGADLYACLEAAVEISPGGTALIPTGIALALPVGYAGFIYARSGLATKEGVAPANKVGVIDCDYRGEIFVSLYNHSGEIRQIFPGERIAQLVIAPYITADFTLVEELPETARGAGGFGSTGKA